MNEQKIQQVLTKCNKIGKFIRFIWGLLALALIFVSLTIPLMFVGPLKKSDFSITATHIKEHTVYTFEIGEDNEYPILMNSYSNNIDLNKKGLDHPYEVYLIFQASNYLVTWLVFYIISQLRRIFLNFSDDETPFTMNNSLRIKKIGWTAIALSFITPMMFSLLCAIFGFGSFSFNIDLPMLIIFGGSCLALAHIFEYGAALQQESDELL